MQYRFTQTILHSPVKFLAERVCAMILKALQQESIFLDVNGMIILK